MPAALTRDLHTLQTETFDLLVIGGGIYGLTIACDAAQRGLRVALAERNDFGSGTSFNHLRTIHGGLRYLQTLDLARARESVRERRTLARIAPWSVEPVPFVLPLTRSLMKGTLAMRAGFLLDAVVARDRNDEVAAAHRLPTGRVLSTEDARRRYPSLATVPMTGAAVWYDYVTTDADRLTLAWALEAAANGGVLANYVDVSALESASDRMRATATDRVTGDTFSIAARFVVNATGGRINQFLGSAGARVELPLLQAMNLVTRLDAPSAAIGGRSASGRNLFLVPWKGRALFGTWESPAECGPDDITVQDAHVDAFIRELNQAFPAFRLTRDEVTLVHRGIVPACVKPDGSLTLDGRELIFEHHEAGLERVISVSGTSTRPLAPLPSGSSTASASG
ncbi:MAG: FAD-dependent oxidoreductase [Vicinamibacterales bacterium]